jgi:hypothetical protein
VYGAPCTLNLNSTTTLKPSFIMCSYTATDTQCEALCDCSLPAAYSHAAYRYTTATKEGAGTLPQ